MAGYYACGAFIVHRCQRLFLLESTGISRVYVLTYLVFPGYFFSYFVHVMDFMETHPPLELHIYPPLSTSLDGAESSRIYEKEVDKPNCRNIN